MTDADMDRRRFIDRLEEHGEDQVRMMLQTGAWPQSLIPVVMEWLKEKRQEADRLSATSQAEMASAASRAAIAAERAADAAEEQARIAKHALITAIAATIIAAVALIASIVSLGF